MYPTSLVYSPLLQISSSALFLPRNILPSGLRNHCIGTLPVRVLISEQRVFQPEKKGVINLTEGFASNPRKKVRI